MCDTESPGGLDTAHSRHVDVHQHDPSNAVRNDFDRGFTGLAIAGHREIFGGRHGCGRGEPETRLVVNHPDPHPFVCHLWMMRYEFVPHDGVHTTVLHAEPRLLRNINTALTRRSTESSTVKPSLAKIELMCFSTAR